MSVSGQRHRLAWELIPWIVNGSAPEEQHLQAREHLRECDDCRAELAFQERLHAAMACERGTPPLDADGGLAKLRARIDGHESARQAAPPAARSPPRTPSGNGALTRWLVAAVVIETVGLGALSTVLWTRATVASTSAVYRTLSLPDGTPSRATIRAVLAPGMTLEQLRSLLAATHLEVVAGPGDAGIWALVPTGSTDAIATEAAVHELRTRSDVRLAEPIDATAGPP